MNVKELWEALAGLDDGLEVLASRDAEGNGFRPVHNVEVMALKRDEFTGEDVEPCGPHGYYEGGALCYPFITAAMREQGYTGEDVNPNGARKVVVW